jgi:hypothetical protein
MRENAGKWRQFSATPMPEWPCAGVNVIHRAGAFMHARLLSQVVFDAIQSSRQSWPAQQNFQFSRPRDTISAASRPPLQTRRRGEKGTSRKFVRGAAGFISLSPSLLAFLSPRLSVDVGNSGASCMDKAGQSQEDEESRQDRESQHASALPRTQKGRSCRAIVGTVPHGGRGDSLFD